MEDDIVKRLLKVAAVSEIIKDNPKIYYDAAHEIARLRERLAEADEANRRVSDENEKLREALKTVCLGVVSERESLDWFIMDGAALRVARDAIRENGE